MGVHDTGRSPTPETDSSPFGVDDSFGQLHARGQHGKRCCRCWWDWQEVGGAPQDHPEGRGKRRPSACRLHGGQASSPCQCLSMSQARSLAHSPPNCAWDPGGVTPQCTVDLLHYENSSCQGRQGPGDHLPVLILRVLELPAKPLAPLSISVSDRAGQNVSIQQTSSEEKLLLLRLLLLLLRKCPSCQLKKSKFQNPKFLFVFGWLLQVFFSS